MTGESDDASTTSQDRGSVAMGRKERWGAPTIAVRAPPPTVSIRLSDHPLHPVISVGGIGLPRVLEHTSTSSMRDLNPFTVLPAHPLAVVETAPPNTLVGADAAIPVSTIAAVNVAATTTAATDTSAIVDSTAVVSTATSMGGAVAVASAEVQPQPRREAEMDDDPSPPQEGVDARASLRLLVPPAFTNMSSPQSPTPPSPLVTAVADAASTSTSPSVPATFITTDSALLSRALPPSPLSPSRMSRAHARPSPESQGMSQGDVLHPVEAHERPPPLLIPSRIEELGWRTRVSRTTGRVYWQHLSTGVSTYTDPRGSGGGAAAAAAAAVRSEEGDAAVSPFEQPQTPHGWLTRISRSTGRLYFVHPSTGISTFVRPHELGGALIDNTEEAMSSSGLTAAVEEAVAHDLVEDKSEGDVAPAPLLPPPPEAIAAIARAGGGAALDGGDAAEAPNSSSLCALPMGASSPAHLPSTILSTGTLRQPPVFLHKRRPALGLAAASISRSSRALAAAATAEAAAAAAAAMLSPSQAVAYGVHDVLRTLVPESTVRMCVSVRALGGTHTIDVLLQHPKDGRPIAILTDGPSHYVSAPPTASRSASDMAPAAALERTGATLLRDRLLRGAGYTVVILPAHEWEALAGVSERAALLRERLGL